MMLIIARGVGQGRKTALLTVVGRPVSAWKALREGALNSLTNSKSLLFMLTFLPLFVDPAADPVWLQLLG
ncbi:hypothetical protein [Shinella sp.]|uniref:hypothetical protein n=1 Tax=Shinella sp. TaxID=1870904 RepID=UPI0029B55C3B|nr:hypothetical protein [Shinella sp.]MDX3978547.1 hypothetical protein [Shinella sp.]